MRANIVVIDDDLAMREMLEDFCKSQGYSCMSYSLASQAFEAFQSMDLSALDVILTDQNMPEMDGLEFTQRMHRFAPDIPVIIMTAYASIDAAIEATRQGAFSYISKPFKLTELDVCLQKAKQWRSLKRENEELKNSVKGGWRFGKMIGKSRPMVQLFDLVSRVAPAQSTVLITGDSGTGKELVARAIHDKSSRKDGPFIAINCSAIPESLLESELFGHMKGSFTGALADKKGLFEEAKGGTLFLDEIGDLDFNLQAKLLRVLQEKTIKPVGANREKPIDVRVISATHKNLSKAVEDGQFREDLFYRLSVLPIHLPPLKQRKEDIPLLAVHFLQKYSALNKSSIKEISPEALSELMEHTWKGNVRELENIIERVTVLNPGHQIESFGLLSTTKTTDMAEDFFQEATADWPTIEELTNRYTDIVLSRTGGKKEKAAQILGINRRTLYRREKEQTQSEL